MPGLVLGQDVLALAQLLAQVGHLLAQRRVLLLQEGRANGDLVLLEAPRVARALGRHVVLPAPRPVLVVLQVVWDEDFARFLNHGLWLQLFLGELAFARVKHLLARDAGEGEVGRVRLVAHGHLDGVGVDGARSIAVGWQQLAWSHGALHTVWGWDARVNGCGGPTAEVHDGRGR